MKPKFNKKKDYNELDVLDEIVRARLFADYACLDAYEVVLRYNTVCTDKRLKKLVKQI